jgi:Glyoxalase-like domain
MPKLELDHLVVAATSLEEGRLFVREQLGLELRTGGRHERMGTHNCLLRIGATSYLEVISVDPECVKPEVPRWFGLDSFVGSPRLLHWVVRVTTRDLEMVRLPEHGPIYAMTRGLFSWQITIPTDGGLPGDGLIPTLIAWDSGSSHPCDVLKPNDCSLIKLEGTHPEANRIAGQISKLGLEDLIRLTPGPISLRASMQIGSEQIGSGLRHLAS